MFYEYVKVDNPKLSSKSLFSRKYNEVINIRKVKGNVEVSIAHNAGDYPVFDVKLVGDKLWSRYGLTSKEYTDYFALLSLSGELFPNTLPDWGEWEEHVRR